MPAEQQRRIDRHPSCPYRRIALTFQGGGALGAYQAGVFEALTAEGMTPDWVAGISIGAINAAIVAGNPPERRVAQLRQFWETVSANWIAAPALEDDQFREAYNQLSAASTLLFGQPGFFHPHPLPPWLHPPGSEGATSFYSTGALRDSLAKLVDFDLVNAGSMRLSLGAVAVSTGNFAYFDSRKERIRPEHVVASGALPPGFPAVEIDGNFYWDGGLVSNTPVQYVLEDQPRVSSLVFQVDLFSAKGLQPRTLTEVLERQKDIVYSSRTRQNVDSFRRQHNMRRAMRRMLDAMSAEQRAALQVPGVEDMCSDAVMNIVHLIYRRKIYESHAKDYEFSRRSMEDHWSAGYDDTQRSLRHPGLLDPPPPHIGVVVHDLTSDA
jgi:NTE family protein